MGTGQDQLDALISDTAAALNQAERSMTTKDALPLLSRAQEQLTRAIDEAMAAAVLEEGNVAAPGRPVGQPVGERPWGPAWPAPPG